MLYITTFAVVGIAPAFSPLAVFYFRHWEAVRAHSRSLFPGPFYPLQKSFMIEEGDLGHGTPYAVLKNVYWETDRYGYRKADSSQHPEIVIIGDSNIVGSSLTQDSTFSEVLQKKVGQSTYPYAPGNINSFLQDTRFINNPPKIVILSCIERSILIDTDQIQNKLISNLNLKSKITNEVKTIISSNNRFVTHTAITLDRIRKQELKNYIQAKIEPKTMGVRYHDMLFYEGPNAVTTAEDFKIQKTIKIISEYNKYFKKKHIYFMYMPVPNKETIYYDLLPSKPKFTILKQIQQGLKLSGVPTIDVLSAYESHKKNGKNPYQIDDTHWNAMGVKIAADIAANMIQKPN